MVFAITTVKNIASETVRAISAEWGVVSNRRRKLTALSTAPASTPTRISFHRTANRSRKCTSPVAIARITMVLLCEPALPPVSVSIGIKVTSIGTAAKALSYFARMLPVIMPDTISAISQKILFFAKVKAPVCR